MRRLRGSFLLRSWDVGAEERFEVEHIQTGAHVTVLSLDAACQWIVARHTHEPGSDGEESQLRERRTGSAG